ncbi:MAG: ATP-dependent DNA helicase PcrA [Armatimonadetes bacterium]|nr:ATP-dependent DNA helicase PcrA [Armatimonadota bacterium]
MTLLNQLNDPQREAVTTTEGPILVLAGAGSGKTRVLTYRIAHILEKGLATPNEILAVTFTNKAAGEVRERVSHLVGPTRFPFLGTFHACCIRMLRTHADRIGMPSGFSIYDTSDQLTLLKEVARDLNVSDERLPPRRALAIISRAKNKLESPSQFSKTANTPEYEIVAGLYREYQKRLETNNAMDFDDILVKAVELLKANADVLEQYQERFKYILVDEYQDVNFAQYMLIRMLAGKHLNLCVVGDDDQSIYGFRGADVSIILQFEKDFPSARVIKLEQNYRSTQSVLDAANAVVANNPNRKDKMMWTANSKGERPRYFEASEGIIEARYVIKNIKDMVRTGGRSYGDFAVLYRTNAQSRLFEDALKLASIPYILVGGQRFYDRKEIKDLVAYMRAVVNPDDDLNLKRIINVPARGIGTITLNRIVTAAARQGLSFHKMLRGINTLGDITPKALSAVSEVVGLIDDLQRRMETQPPKELLERIIRVTGFKDHLAEDRTPEGRSRLENVAELVNVAAQFERDAEREGIEPTLENFLNRIALVADVDALKEEGGAVTLMTLHSAKGLEYPVVFLAGMEEGLFPHSRVFTDPRELEEERRLCYVGMTRAREQLVLTRARVRDMYGESRSAIESQFVKEIPEQMLEREELDGSVLAEEERYSWGRSTSYTTPPTRATPPAPTYGRQASTTSSRSSASRSGPVVTKRASAAVRAMSAPSFTASVEAPKPPPVSLYKEGMTVRHKVFGEGKVQKVDGKTVTAEFPGYGEKTVVDSFLSLVR